MKFGPAFAGNKNEESQGIEMTLTDKALKALELGSGSTLLRIVALAALLTAVLPLPEAVSAASASDGHAAETPRERPHFGLPPIVVQVMEKRDPTARVVIFKANLFFDEVDQDRINDTMRVTKSLLPRIMDSVITGIQGKRFDDLSDFAWLNEVVLRRSNAVLKPYGVEVSSLELKDLSRP
jgi:hypothetical protein